MVIVGLRSDQIPPPRDVVAIVGIVLIVLDTPPESPRKRVLKGRFFLSTEYLAIFWVKH